MNGDRLRIGCGGKAGHDDAEIFRIREVDLADSVGGTGANDVGVAQKFLVGLHALFALFAGHAVWQAGDDREMQILGFGTVENYAVGIDQSEFRAVTQKRDGSALREFDTDAVWQNALHAGGFDPGKLFELSAPGVQRNAEHAAASVVRERLKDGFA